LVQSVFERADDELRDVLLDWLGGMTIRESATGLGIRRAVVVKRRERLVRFFEAERFADDFASMDQ
jgi:hypothetical protein